MFKRHKLSELFKPYDLSVSDMAKLKESIAHIGVQNPITMYENMVLDGWNRYSACLELCIEPPLQDFNGTNEQAWAFVMAQNMMRRSLSQSEKLRILTIYLQENGSTKKTAGDLAAEHKVSRASANRAVIVAERATNEQIDDIRGGNKSVFSVYEDIKGKKEEGAVLDEGDDDYVGNLEKDVARLTGLVNKLSQSDLGKQIVEMQKQIDALTIALNTCNTTRAEAQKECAKWMNLYTKSIGGTK
jgi:hypothetical protein